MFCRYARQFIMHSISIRLSPFCIVIQLLFFVLLVVCRMRAFCLAVLPVVSIGLYTLCLQKRGFCFVFVWDCLCCHCHTFGCQKRMPVMSQCVSVCLFWGWACFVPQAAKNMTSLNIKEFFCKYFGFWRYW